MRYSAISLPKKKPEEGTGELCFGSAPDAIGAYHARTAGKILLISDGEGLSTIAPLSNAPRMLFVVLEAGDALPLFTMPDGVGGVVAVGGQDAMRAARFYAALHGIQPLLLPSDGALDGACGACGRVKIEGNERTLPLAAGKIICDLALMRSTLGRAYARLLLVRLAAFECKALSRFQMTEYPVFFEELLSIIEGAEDGESVVRANAAVRAFEAQGLPRGEGETLAALLPLGGEFVAFRALCALYTAFFSFATPRKYFCPDYHARAERAGVAYGSLYIPTREELERRTVSLEKMRRICRDELLFLSRQEPMHMRNIRALCGETAGRISSEALKILPERCPHGLSAVIRDFGLMEF